MTIDKGEGGLAEFKTYANSTLICYHIPNSTGH